MCEVTGHAASLTSCPYFITPGLTTWKPPGASYFLWIFGQFLVSLHRGNHHYQGQTANPLVPLSGSICMGLSDPLFPSHILLHRITHLCGGNWGQEDYSSIGSHFLKTLLFLTALLRCHLSRKVTVGGKKFHLVWTLSFLPDLHRTPTETLVDLP